jgi:antitoxin component YwqK of YwqJK toxin-antitoxin module
VDKQKIFQKNLELWAKVCPKQALMLPYIDCSCIEEVKTKLGEPNLRKQEASSELLYHSNEGAVKEAQMWFAELPLHNIPLLIVFGVGLGYYYETAIAWLRKDSKRQLIFFENDLSVIKVFFETERATRLLQDRQVQLLYFRDLEDEEATFEVLYWQFTMKRMVVSGLASYKETKKELFSQLRHKIAYDTAVKNALIDEYLRYGGSFFINYYQNMLCIADSYFGNRIFGKFQRVPAIICGAGPSLEKNVALLGSLLDRAIVFAGGSSLNALNAAGFQPHFGAGIDPNPMQLIRLSQSQGYEVPFFYRNRLFHDAFKMIHGPKLYVTGAGGYDIAEFFEEKFGVHEDFIDEGHNVVNFCVQIANMMGCNPILFLGMDLAFTDMREYAPGVVEDAAVNQSEIVNVEEEDDRAILRKDMYGQPIYTLWKWVAEAQWLGDFAKEHSALTMINCTEGGLGFPGVPNNTLAEVAAKYLNRCHELSDRVHGETQNCVFPRPLTYVKVAKTARELAETLKRAVNHFAVLEEDNRRAIERTAQGEMDVVQSGKAALAEAELETEPGYQYLVDIFNAVYSRVLSQELHQINTGRYSKKQRAIKKYELNAKRFKFLKEVSQLNIDLIDFAFKERKKSKRKKRAKPEVNPPIIGESSYEFSEGMLVIKDKACGLAIDEKYDPVLIPSMELRDGQTIGDSHCLRVFFDDKWKRCESYVEYNGQPDGQSLLFYENGAKKAQTFYRMGKLHGPSTFWSETGGVLAKSWFYDGRRVGKSLWNYPSGNVYSIQSYKNGVWHGFQAFYYENGNVKTLMHYEHGRLTGKALLLANDGSYERLLAIDDTP